MSSKPYIPPFQGKPYAQDAEKVYHKLIGAGCCSGRQDDLNIETIREAIESAVDIAFWNEDE
jgi:hypothetical protein